MEDKFSQEEKLTIALLQEQASSAMLASENGKLKYELIAMKLNQYVDSLKKKYSTEKEDNNVDKRE